MNLGTVLFITPLNLYTGWQLFASMQDFYEIQDV